MKRTTLALVLLAISLGCWFGYVCGQKHESAKHVQSLSH